ncbi:MAG: DUF998 domain-containing protein [Micromonosporaceae bacterium]
MKPPHPDPVQAPPVGTHRWLVLSAVAGVVGPILFTVTFLAQEAFRIGEYSPVAEPVSALEAGPYGWVQQLNFVVFGLLTCGFAVGLHRALRPARWGMVGPALLFISGIGLLLAAIFPLREDAPGVTYDPGGHVVAGVTFFLSSAVGLTVLYRRVARDPRWRDLAGYTLGAGLLALAGFVVTGVLVLPDGAPLHDWAGLVQRALILLVIFPCRVVLSVRMLRVPRQVGHHVRRSNVAGGPAGASIAG